MENENVEKRFLTAAEIAFLISNDINYMHLLSKGKDFDKFRNLAESYYKMLDEEVDYLMKLVLENGDIICNYMKNREILPDYIPEEKHPTTIKLSLLT